MQLNAAIESSAFLPKALMAEASMVRICIYLCVKYLLLEEQIIHLCFWCMPATQRLACTGGLSLL